MREPFVGQITDILRPRIAELSEGPSASVPLADHLVDLGRDDWTVWRTMVLRGAGFPAAGVLELAVPDCARAEERWATAVGRFLAFRDRARDTVRAALTAPVTEDDDRERRRALRRALKRLGKERLPDNAEDLLGGQLASRACERLGGT